MIQTHITGTFDSAGTYKNVVQYVISLHTYVTSLLGVLWPRPKDGKLPLFWEHQEIFSTIPTPRFGPLVVFTIKEI